MMRDVKWVRFSDEHGSPTLRDRANHDTSIQFKVLDHYSVTHVVTNLVVEAANQFATTNVSK
jgi:hypothetical protein